MLASSKVSFASFKKISPLNVFLFLNTSIIIGVIDLVWDKYIDDTDVDQSRSLTRDRQALQPYGGYAYPGNHYFYKLLFPLTHIYYRKQLLPVSICHYSNNQF